MPSKASVRPVHRARLSRVVTAALLSEVALIVAFPDLRSKVPEDPARNRDVEEEVRQHQVPDVVVAVGRLSGSMGAYRSRTNADDRLPRDPLGLDPLGRVQGGDGIVEGRDVTDAVSYTHLTLPTTPYV